jgi:DNA repair protein RecN (Recombination protein N)
MLKKLFIQNYALIDEIEIRFDRGLNILTGETGAGKSIILGALGLIMGKRADLKALYDPSKNCMVEAILDIAHYQLEKVLAEHEVEYEHELVIRRVILKSGKSRAFVNDLPVTLRTLEEITGHLIQMHQQFDNLDLVDPAYQLKMLDAQASNDDLLINYQRNYDQWMKEKKELNLLLDEKAGFERERDFIQFQYDELMQIDLEAALEDDIESTLELLSNAESIQQALQSSYYSLTEEEDSIVNRLNAMLKQLRQAGSGTHIIDDLSEKIELSVESLEDLSNQLYEHAEKIEYDPKRIEELQDTQNQINKLLLKHRLENLQELIELRKELDKKLSRVLTLDDSISEKEDNIDQLGKSLESLARDLSKKRRKTAGEFGEKIMAILVDLGMPHAKIEGRFEQLEVLGPMGSDAFELLFSANKGTQPESIKHVASGGELSRLSLSIKSILAGHMSLPTLIFDEIEAGISGEIAMKMGQILKTLSLKHQIINITHSAQIASRGNLHFFVYKSHEKDRSVTRLKELNSQEKITEIAKMLSGDPPSPTAIKNAEELIHLN